MNSLPIETLVERLAFIIGNLKPYEKIEIKLQDNMPGEISVLVTSNYKETFKLL